MSRKSLHSSSSENQFQEGSQEWNFLNGRLTQVEKCLNALTKKYHKLEKKVNQHAREATQLNLEQAEELNSLRSEQITEKQVRFNILEQTKAIKSSIETDIQFKFEKIFTQIAEETENLTELIEDRVNNTSEETKNYINQTISQLKQLLQKQQKERTPIKQTIEINSDLSFKRQSLGSKGRASGRSSKLLLNSQHCREAESVESKILSSEPKERVYPNKDIEDNGSSRVKYLKEKLKEFQRINKKYETPTQRSVEKNENLMFKMKNYKDYLEQSQSQLEPFNAFGEHKKMFLKTVDRKTKK